MSFKLIISNTRHPIQQGNDADTRERLESSRRKTTRTRRNNVERATIYRNTPDEQPCYFFKLPLELRQEIYGYALDDIYRFPDPYTDTPADYGNTVSAFELWLNWEDFFYATMKENGENQAAMRPS
ncbi:hypothetical protein NA57DRAFT_51331 [Rhizodiscina lignyota]|uniref:Uncharacterized protein n=1 Tax=Rhizodiscina lignyota TaxID=1504668 RepID=A0A9P4IN01_9PEZI|nr:hypothetical protein NA57DRAFT_51331 [Rhizodiscina lignyota]